MSKLKLKAKILACALCVICKVNFATELRAAYTKAARECLDADKAVYDPKKFGTQGREAVAELVRHRIRVCTSRG